ncbi:MAG: polysaccharide biosynthesis protein [Oscillospiraceae bacterium]|nr:polysaccharide biosynthesis protein [Oscillospiraceae bacterium]
MHKYKKFLPVFYDVAIINLMMLAAYFLEFGTVVLPENFSMFALYPIANTVLTVFLFWRFKMYSFVWEYFGIRDFIKIFFACFVSAIVLFATLVAFNVGRALNFSTFYLAFLLLGAVLPRLFRFLVARSRKSNAGINRTSKRIMVVGGGLAGLTLINEIKKSSYLNDTVVCCIDDDPGKKNKFIHGVKIVGGKSYIPRAVEKYGIDIIYIAMPSAPTKVISEFYAVCKSTKREVKTLPGLYQLINGEVSVSLLREVKVEDLLDREPVDINMLEIAQYITDKVVLVSGGGGSIGSELCRQIAKYAPSKLIILDIYENNIYDLEQELIKAYPTLKLEVLIASVRDEKRIDDIFATYRPNLVYHAAAHKHVPLMEKSPNEAIKNNVFGTKNVAEAAARHGTQRFVLVSTDKAVNPTNIMGATKRLCEMVIQTMNKKHDTDFVAVRFGNVLNSAGSVVPLFQKQIKDGGPITITHKEMVRYFMTISEAVLLILQAGYYAKGGEIFVLDMGTPVKIDDMARNLITLSGLVPDVDIEITYTGLRPGEKLFEEMLMDEEGLKQTKNKLIYIARPIELDECKLTSDCAELRTLAEENSTKSIAKIKEIVTTYKCADQQ